MSCRSLHDLVLTTCPAWCTPAARHAAQACKPWLMGVPGPGIHLASWSAFSPASSGSCSTCWSQWFSRIPSVLLVCCDSHHRPDLSLSQTPCGQGVFYHLCGPAHSRCSTHLKPLAFTYLLHQKWKLCRNCINLSRFSRVIQISKISCPIVRWCPFQFWFRKHVCHFYRLHEGCIWGHLSESMPVFLTTRVLSAWRGTGEWKILSRCL